MMFRKILKLCSAFFLLTITTVQAQNAQLEAKASYLLAEESYGKGDMRAALDFINEASTKLGTANAKICYLKIMILKELSAKDTSALLKMDTAITEFEKAPDAADFNEEKTLEIVKLKIERKRNAAITADEDQKMNALQKKLGWFIGMSVDSMLAWHKDKFDAYFKQNPSLNNKVKSTHYISFPLGNLRTENIYIKDDRLLTYSKHILGALTEVAGFPTTKQTVKAVLEDIKSVVGYIPDPKIEDEMVADGGRREQYTYTWKSGKVIVTLITMQITVTSFNKQYYTSTCLLSMSPGMAQTQNN